MPEIQVYRRNCPWFSSFVPPAMVLPSLPAPPMSESQPIRFANGDLARRIARIHGGETTTVKVTMVGGTDVSKLLKKVRRACNTPPSTTFRVK